MPRKKSSVPATQKGGGVPATIAGEMAKDAGQGAGFKPDEVSIPFLAILQSGSPQVKKGPAKIEGAEEGDIFNTVTQEIYKEGVRVVPCYFQKQYVEWKPRTAGGGFVRQHGDPAIMEKTHINPENGRSTLDNGNEIVPTAYYFVLVEAGKSFERAVISMSSTQLKKSRRWNAQISALQIDSGGGRMVTPPIFSHFYKLSTVEESNDQGAWMGWKIGTDGMLSDLELYRTARQFHDQLAKNEIDIAPPQTQDEQHVDGGNPPEDVI